jgi:hypothetical protein
MQRRERQLARLLRALIACCALLLAGASPAHSAGSAAGLTPAADVSAWVVARVSAPAAARARSAVRSQAAAASPRRSSVAAASPARTLEPRPLREQRRARRDGRHLYLELQTLLC